MRPDAIQKAKIEKSVYRRGADRPYASQSRRRTEAQGAPQHLQALAEFVRRHGGLVTSPPGKTLRIEIAKDASAKLTDELTRLGYRVMRVPEPQRA